MSVLFYLHNYKDTCEHFGGAVYQVPMKFVQVSYLGSLCTQKAYIVDKS